MRLLWYSLLRLALLAAALGLGYLLGLRNWLLLLVAVAIAGALSYLLLKGQRDRAVGDLSRRFPAPPPREDPDAALEDSLDDAARGPAGGTAPSERERSGQ